jgi:hypothetical protein
MIRGPVVIAVDFTGYLTIGFSGACKLHGLLPAPISRCAAQRQFKDVYSVVIAVFVLDSFFVSKNNRTITLLCLGGLALKSFFKV